MKKQDILLIINPAAGRRKGVDTTFRIVDTLSRNACKTTVFTTSQKGDAIDIVKEHGGEAEKIICCGGDGTLSEVINGLALAGLQIPVGYIPTGTTNDMARALNLPTRQKRAIQNAIDGKIREHDIGAFNETQYFAYVASFGAFTKAAYDTPQKIKNVFGRISYVFNSFLRIGEIRPYAVKVIADGKEITGDFVFGSVSNSTVVGGVMRFPEKDVIFDDGMFEVMLIKNPTTPIELQNTIYSVFNQKYDENYVLFFKASRLSFSFEKQAEWSIDGEFAGAHEAVRIENLQSAAGIISG